MKKEFREYRQEILRAEKGSIFGKKAELKIALGYANSYEVGISNLGFQTVYRLLTEQANVSCERFFFERELGEESCYTLESGSPLLAFDIIAFSISYELDLINLLRVLKMANLLLLAKDREGKNLPLAIAGGMAPTLNPEPFAPFFDLIFIGEAEDFFSLFIKTFLRNKSKSRGRLLTKLSELEGVYLPRLYSTEYDRAGRQTSFVAVGEVPKKVKRAVDLRIGQHPAYSPVTSRLSHFKESFLIEVGRGCPHRCKFCAACPVYSPTRFSSPEIILKTIENHCPGAIKVGLVGTLLSDYPELANLCRRIVESGLTLGISSFRADKVDLKVIEYLRKSGELTLTLAPEVGDQSLRFTIGKKIKDQEILEGAELADRVGIRSLRLYFMVGLPGETPAAMEAIVELVGKIKRDHFRGNIRISLTPFIPKPWTPFMYAPYARKRDLEQRVKSLRSRLARLRGVSLRVQGLRSAEVSALISVGTRTVGEALGDRVTIGSSFKSLLNSRGVDLEALLYSEKSTDALFPWDFIDLGLDKKRLYNLYKEKAD